MLHVRYHHNTTGKQLQMRYDTMRYLACSKKLMGSQLSQSHGWNTQCKKNLKNKLMSVIRPVQSQSQCVCNLGIYTDADLMMRTVAVLRRPTSTIWQIRQLVPRDTLQMLVVALVHHSRLDYGNSVLTGIPAYPISHADCSQYWIRLQGSSTSWGLLTTSLMHWCLHWLRISERI